LVKIEAVPSDFWVYPSPLTSSSAPCSATPGHDWIFMNPLYIEDVAAAPGRGTALDVVEGEFIATAGQEEAILIALLVPAVQKVREAAARVAPLPSPTNLTYSGESGGLNECRLSLNFAKVDNKYDVRLGDLVGFSGPTIYEIYHNGALVVTYKEAGLGTLQVESLPDVFASRIDSVLPTAKADARSHSQAIVTILWDGSVRFFPERGPVILGDTLIIRSQCTNNLKQLGLGIHTFEATGVQTMRITPESRP
jgi:hypothetical protein